MGTNQSTCQELRHSGESRNPVARVNASRDSSARYRSRWIPTFTGMTAAFVLTVLLSACTAIHPPAPYLPEKASIVPGEEVTIFGHPTLYAIARKHNVSLRDIIVLNDLKAPFILKDGQHLILPAGGDGSPIPAPSPSGIIDRAPLGTAPESASSSAVTSAILPAPVTSSPVEALNTPSPAPKAIATTVQPTAIQTAQAAPTPLTPPPESAADSTAEESSAVSMVWPVQGPVLSGFGDKTPKGLTNDGVNIGAPKGSPVVAAANGIVVYAGNEMKGFGNLILIRHEGGWVTAYAYLDRVLVSKDAAVAKGDMIGTVGKSGDATAPQIHFETRLNGKPVDPKTAIKD